MVAEQSTDKAKDVIEKGAEITNDAIKTVAIKATSATNRAKEATQDALDDSRDALESALVCSKDMIRTHPIAAVTVVAAIAYLLGRIAK